MTSKNACAIIGGVKRRSRIKQKKISLFSFLTKETIVVAGLLLLAFILKFIYLSHLKANDHCFYLPQQGTDMLGYHDSAQQILNGTFPKAPYYAGPFYSYFLAFIYKIFGVDPYIARLIQIILGVTTSLLIYLIAKKVFNKPVAVISLCISVFYSIFYIYEGILLMETLVCFLNTLSVFLLLRIEDKPSYKNIAFAGISIGISALSRATILLFVPFILIWIFFNSKLKTQNSKLLRFGFLCLVILLTISPATIRNYLVSGKFILISANGTVAIWLGNNPYSTAVFTSPPSSYTEKITKKAEKEGEKVYLQEAIKFIKENPKDTAKLYLEKFLFFWSKEEADNNINTPLQKSYSFIFRFPVIFGFNLICPLALCGIILSFRKKVLLLNLFLFGFMMSMLPFYILSRYRIAFVPILIIFAGFFIFYSYERFRKKGLLSFFLSLLLLIPCSLFVYSQSIANPIYSHIHPNGVVVNRPDKLIFRDDRDTYGRDFDLNNTIKKEIVIEEDPSNFEEGVLFFNFFGGNPPGILDISINDKRFEAPLQPSGGLLIFASIKIPVTWLKRGVNTIILKPKDTVKATSIAIDPSYSFGRSYILNQSCKWEQLKKGEFMLHLELKKFPVAIKSNVKF